MTGPLKCSSGTGMFTSTKWGTSPFVMQIYKITKIVWALWLTERSVCMTVCKHVSVVASRCIGFCMLITRAWIWKSFWVQNSTGYLPYLPIPSSAETWKIFTNKLCQFFFRLSWHFKWGKSLFWKASFCETRTDCKTSCTRLCDW